jgi:hypothetical protein
MVSKALQLHGPKCCGSNIRIFTDNTTALKYARKAGGTDSPLLQALSIDIQETLNFLQIQCQFLHIQG